MNELLDRIGNWNPQLLREIRGKLKFRTVALTIAISLVIQILILLYQFQRIPNPDCTSFTRCASNWESWWLGQFRFLFWLIPIGLFFLGTFNLVTDLSQENSKGTLNFIRLSPRSSQTIFLGKLLGVPILVYLGIFLLMPLHIISALGGGLPLWFVISYYSLLIAFSILIFSLAIVFALIGFGEQKLAGIQAYTGAIFLSGSTLFIFTPLFIFWNLSTSWSGLDDFLLGAVGTNNSSVQWWYLPLSENNFLAHLFSFSVIGITCALLWQILSRRFHNPKATILSKGLSYITTAFVEVFILGFLIRSNAIVSGSNVLFVYLLNFSILFSLVVLLSPIRPEVKEWASFIMSGNWLSDLIWFDKTPSIVAIFINIIISQMLVLGWILIGNDPNKLNNLFIIVLLSLQWIFYGLVYQNILLTRLSRSLAWAVGTLLTLMILPTIFMAVLRLTPSQFPYLWLILGAPWSIFSFTHADTLQFISAFVTFAVGIFILGAVLFRRVRHLRL